MLNHSTDPLRLAAENQPSAQVDPAGGPVVFVVDDEPGIIRLCERLLERAGFQVFAYTDPQVMLLALQQRHADLLLADIRMPGLDGFQVINLARQQYPDLAVVIMTGFGTVETAIEALREGADGLILKPFAGAELTSSVTRALQQSLHKQDVLRLQALRPLFDVTEALFSETNPRRLRTLILEAVSGHLKCRHAEFYRLKETGSDRKTAAGERKSPAGSGRGRESSVGAAASLGPLVEQLIAQANRNAEPGEQGRKGKTPMRAPMLFGDQNMAAGPERSLTTEEQTLATEERTLEQLLASFRIRSLMCAPVMLKAGGRGATAGSQNLLVAARAENEPPFRESDLEMFAILARQAAVAQENARLQAELREYIHQLEASQRALIQAEKMATAGRLTASIAHEINNPLQAVQNCVHLAGRMELAVQERQNYLNLAQSELERLMQTVQRMLDFYRPAALDRKPIDINVLIEKVLSLMGKQLKDHRIQVHLKMAAHLPYVFAVGDQIQQVLLNLILNAMEAMSKNERSELFIESRTNLVGESPGAQVEIYIQDSGPGVPANERKHIFEPFVSTKAQGTGLGLAVSYGIITAHGGSLELVDYDPPATNDLLTMRKGTGATGPQPVRRGACFRVSLPVAEYT